MEEIFDLDTVHKMQKAIKATTGSVKPKYYGYEGTCFADNNVTRDTLHRVRDFQARKDDVFIVTYPKAGTTWAQEIMYLAMNGGNVDKAKKSHTMYRIPYVEFKPPTGQIQWFRYPLQSLILLWCILKIMFRSFLYSLRQGKFSVPDNYDLIKLIPSPRLLKSHLPAHLLPPDIFAKKSKIVYVARNPKDLAVSFFHFHKWNTNLPQYESWDQFFDDFLAGKVHKMQKAIKATTGSVKPKYYGYEGTCFADNNVTRDTLHRVRDFQARKDDVFIVTYPKAGTTWAQEIMYLAMNGGNVDKAKKSHTMYRIPYVEFKPPTGQIQWFRYPLQSLILLWCILKIMFRSFLYSLRQGKFSVPDNYDLIKLIPSPRLLKSHLPAHLLPPDIFAKKSKIVYVARNPKDLAVSFFHFHKWNTNLPQYESWDQFFDDFLAGKVTYGKWYEHVLGFWKRRNEDNILFLFYEDMKKDEKAAVRQICKFLGYHYSDDVIDRITQHSTFGSMKKNPMTNPDSINDRSKDNATFMRKGVVGDWRNYFSEKQNEALDAICDEKLTGTGLQFKFEILNNNNN